ncbi:MAG: DEAD/DEAH box helicase [Chloroflexota bacterium]|nr:DEAD/DEAH box helicase [Chloroflexota bacterium]
MQFNELNLIDPLLRAVREEGYTTPTPIQQQAIPQVLNQRDLLGIAQTGTGKTAAFALPILQHLAKNPRQHRGIRALILAPTRELAAQIGDSFSTYGKYTGIKNTVIFGGVGQMPQVDALRRGPEVVVAAPGRLLDLMGQGYIKLDRLEIFVLDEADRMLDMGFIHDVRRVINALPRQRQTLLFSATMPDEIQKLAKDILIDPVRVEVTPVATTVEKIAQSVYFIDQKRKPALLEYLLRDPAIKRVLVFTRTKHGANKVVRGLEGAGIQAEAIHGNKSQTARERALVNFKRGATRVLVATDIAARGIDVEDITHIIQFDLSHEPETYVHRIGRTARAGASGAALAFCAPEEQPLLKQIERLIRLRVPVAELPATLPPASPPAPMIHAQPVHRDAAPRSQPNSNARQQPRQQASSSGQPATRGGNSSASNGAPVNGDAPAKRRRRRRSRATNPTP